jgi:hypothetical protein
MIASLRQPQVGTAPKADMATITETANVDPTGTVQIKIKEEASTRIIRLRAEVKATMMADTGRLREELWILTKGNHH